ncbi:MAG: kynureninase [Alphaproteobacteria bacterium]|nr:kynureninase [Alphaproteobacteria bacterium]
MAALPTRDDCLARDRADPLAPHRAGFDLPERVIYLDGNSLGAKPAAVDARLAEVIGQEWGRDLITSWNRHGWIDLPLRLGDKIARLIGAAPGEVAVADSTSVNLFKVLAAALRLRPGRSTVLSVRDNFPTDLYTAEGVIGVLGNRHRLKLVEADDVAAAVDGDTAAVFLTQVDYRTGILFDMAALTRAAHAAGSLMIWDLAHSAGALPVDLNAVQADFAVGCGYKYLNGGPGAPAFVFVARRHHDEFVQPLSGWFGHAAPFAFEPSYRPAPGIARALCGTPPILSLAALEVGVDTVLAADMAALRAKSMALGDLFIQLVEGQGGDYLGLSLASPRDADQRGSQVSFRHAEGYPVMQALIARGVIGDFRAPDLLRFGFAPLYVRYVDVFDAAAALIGVLASGTWDQPQFKGRAAVT